MLAPYPTLSSLPTNKESSYPRHSFFHVVATQQSYMNHLTWTKMNQLQCCAKLSEGISTFCVESYCNEFKSVLESCVSRGAGSVLLKFSSSWLGDTGWWWAGLEVGRFFLPILDIVSTRSGDVSVCPWECYVRYSSISNAAVNFTDC